ncbi:hypothetical protein K435DRAFT_807159 [Dendrothele bispora CBS 962.96]|uniref:Uncharacterized protein n=1 Tax=Dendrothele bispora (strain CBS 962.96) TaxID=1314807 RepID=A0A4S8L620_DENBC|nr:hypothetical protein K435DRAFT_807159 [Dendrothele bispora CBS 962.96]
MYWSLSFFGYPVPICLYRYFIGADGYIRDRQDLSVSLGPGQRKNPGDGEWGPKGEVTKKGKKILLNTYSLLVVLSDFFFDPASISEVKEKSIFSTLQVFSVLQVLKQLRGRKKKEEELKLFEVPQQVPEMYSGDSNEGPDGVPTGPNGVRWDPDETHGPLKPGFRSHGTVETPRYHGVPTVPSGSTRGPDFLKKDYMASVLRDQLIHAEPIPV